MHQHSPTVRVRSSPSHVWTVPRTMPSRRRPRSRRSSLSTALTTLNLGAWTYALYTLAVQITHG